MKTNKLYHQNCIQGMKKMEDDCIDLVVTSPPFNIGKEYEEKMTLEQYLVWSEKYLTQIYRVLKSGRSLFLELGCYVDDDTNNIPISYLLYPILQRVGFKLRQEIVWRFKGGMQAKLKLTGQNEKVLWLYKPESNRKKQLPFFDLDAIRVKEWEVIDARNNPNGKNPTDVWEINRVAGNSKEKTNHPCQFPLELVDRILKGWSKEDEVVLDPFMGSGTTACSAKSLNRRYIGFETHARYYYGSVIRVKKTKRGA